MALQRTTGPLTAEDIRDWPDDYELYEGVPRSVAATPNVSAIAVRATAYLSDFVFPRQLGVVFGADASFRINRDPDDIYLPDAAVVLRHRLTDPAILERYPFEGPPDLAVEVRSPSQSLPELDRKLGRYLAAGLRLGWVIDPLPRGIIVYQPGVALRRLGEDDTLTGGDVLPEFAIPVAALFQIGWPPSEEIF